VIDSNGMRHEYSSAEALPPRERKQLRSQLNALKHAEQGLREAGEALGAMGNMAPLADMDIDMTEAPEPPEAPEAPESPESSEAPQMPAAPRAPRAPRRMRAPLPPPPPRAPHAYGAPDAPLPPSVHWAQINRVVDSAIRQVEHIDWKAIDRDIARAAREAQRTLNSPKMRAEIRRCIAQAEREVALCNHDRERMLAEGRRTVVISRQDMQRVRREVARAQREAQRARVEAEERIREIDIDRSGRDAR
jgi:hypothetical protein